MTELLDEGLLALKKSIRATRAAFAYSKLGRFARAMNAAMRDYDAARKQGVSREDAVLGLEEVLRAEWPFRPTKFPTTDCCDSTGWRLVTCDYALRCGRELCSRREQAWEHTYVVPCDCQAGDKFRRRAPAAADALAAVGRSKKRPRGFSRFGQ